MLNKKTKDNEKNISTNKKRTRVYMNSYEWNYMVLEIVDYLESRFAAEIEYGDDHLSDPWKHFRDYCLQHDLNWRVIRKMIEFSINAPFESEMEMANHESFKSLVKVEDEPEEPLKNKRNAPKKEDLVDIVF